MKFNIILMRAQPLHKGHQYLIDQASKDGTPVVVFGSTQESGTKRNPYTLAQRQHMLKLLYPDIPSCGVPDKDSWDDWYNTVLNTLKFITHDAKIEFYSFRQDEDRCDFEFRGKQYKDELYHRLFEDAGFKVNYVEESPVSCHARDIRASMCTSKHGLDPIIAPYMDLRVYNYIKDL